MRSKLWCLAAALVPVDQGDHVDHLQLGAAGALDRVQGRRAGRDHVLEDDHRHAGTDARPRRCLRAAEDGFSPLASKGRCCPFPSSLA